MRTDREALRRIMQVVGTSTEAHMIARTALAQEPEPDGWIEEDEIPEAGRSYVTWHSEPNASRVPIYIGTPKQGGDDE